MRQEAGLLLEPATGSRQPERVALGGLPHLASGSGSSSPADVPAKTFGLAGQSSGTCTAVRSTRLSFSNSTLESTKTRQPLGVHDGEGLMSGAGGSSRVRQDVSRDEVEDDDELRWRSRSSLSMVASSPSLSPWLGLLNVRLRVIRAVTSRMRRSAVDVPSGLGIASASVGVPLESVL